MLLLLTAANLSAEVTLPAFFSDHVVLQRDRKLPVWGWAAPGERVTVSLGNSRATMLTGPSGRWQVTLAPQPVSKTPLTLTVAGRNTLHIKDVLLGDVWMCSGQSNMEWPLGGCHAPEDMAAADLPLIRHFHTDYNFASVPASDAKGRWEVCSPGSVHAFSAVGFYFARKIHSQTGVPIGLLTNAVGGTNIELWISQQTLLNTHGLESYAEMMRSSLAAHQSNLAKALPALEQWTRSSREALGKGLPVPLLPAVPEFPFGERMARPRCVTLHNGHIAPFIPMALRGVLWYQGENNAGDPLYVEKKKAMVADWRAWFGDPQLPFYYVQLAAFEAPDKNPGGGGWGFIRDEQRRCMEAIPYTGMASAIDIGAADDIHPKNKYDVGERLARWALANQYGAKNTVTSGPLFKAAKTEGTSIRISFNSLGGGLMVASKQGRDLPVEEEQGKLQQFAIAGEDRQWYWAEARIEGETVVASAPEVRRPVAVRYAFRSNPEGANLYNRAGLPASPFRTDNW